ncbi:MAG TPA: hypothetical protein VHH90_05190 [Polyangia bacterium]|nr:hypothetical protein [Polyangia bacterium]
MNRRFVGVGLIVATIVSALALGCGGKSSQDGTGQAGAPAAGGDAGGSSTGGRGGATSAAGSGGTAAGGAPACARCFLSIANRVNCDPSPTATCVEQKSQTTNTDGTITKIDNKCYSDGSKNLQRQLIGPADAGVAGTESVAVQVFKDGSACASGDISYAGTLGDETVTEVFKDGAGNVLATLVIVVTRSDGGDVVQTKTIACPGEAPQPLGPCSSSGSSVTCTAGTCM